MPPEVHSIAQRRAEELGVSISLYLERLLLTDQDGSVVPAMRDHEHRQPLLTA